MLEGAKSIGTGAATIASAGAAVGIGNIFSSLIHSVARNPSLEKQLFGYAIPGFALTEAISLVSLPIEPQRFWSGSISLIKSDPFFSKVPVGFDLPTDLRVRNGKRRISRTSSSNDQFSSAGKQSFTDMGAYSAVAGLVSISLPYDFEKGMDREEGSRVSFSWCQHMNGSCLNGFLFPLLNQL
ncbi:hypothetical protein KIW84_045517 [Lathyrus oleraceus]|uniref:ATP synthase subunit 9, mitochondrial n=1 Tax=Pisum sativum TaxID=3888 RepID=A0A9D4XKW8_PEA|nr:hypothetical protein KIW84_045517 [Pisum sativum]